MTASTRAELIRAVEAYFRDVDRFDTDAILSHLADGAALEVVTHGVRHSGIDAIRAAFDRRAEAVRSSWHGDFEHTVDENVGRVATRLTARRTNADGTTAEAHNLTLFALADAKIQRISIWMSGANTLGG